MASSSCVFFCTENAVSRNSTHCIQMSAFLCIACRTACYLLLGYWWRAVWMIERGRVVSTGMMITSGQSVFVLPKQKRAQRNERTLLSIDDSREAGAGKGSLTCHRNNFRQGDSTTRAKYGGAQTDAEETEEGSGEIEDRNEWGSVNLAAMWGDHKGIQLLRPTQLHVWSAVNFRFEEFQLCWGEIYQASKRTSWHLYSRRICQVYRPDVGENEVLNEKRKDS